MSTSTTNLRTKGKSWCNRLADRTKNETCKYNWNSGQQRLSEARRMLLYIIRLKIDKSIQELIKRSNDFLILFLQVHQIP